MEKVHKIKSLFKRITDPFCCYHEVIIKSKDNFIMNGCGFAVKEDLIAPYINLNKAIYSSSSFLPSLNEFLCQATRVVNFDLKNAKIIKEKIFGKILSYYYFEIDNLPITFFKTYIDFFNMLFDDKNFEKKLFLKEAIWKDRKHIFYYYIIFDKNNKEVVGACQDSVGFKLR